MQNTLNANVTSLTREVDQLKWTVGIGLGVLALFITIISLLG